jgi:hypothetical protein
LADGFPWHTKNKKSPLGRLRTLFVIRHPLFVGASKHNDKSVSKVTTDENMYSLHCILLKKEEIAIAKRA